MLEVRLEPVRQAHPIGIEIAEVKIPAIISPCPPRRSAKGAVTVQPAKGLHIKHRPIMAVRTAPIRIQARLPPGRNPRNPAHGDEGQRLYTAIPPKP